MRHEFNEIIAVSISEMVSKIGDVIDLKDKNEKVLL